MIVTLWGRRSLFFFALIIAVGAVLMPPVQAQTKKEVEEADKARDRAYNELVESRDELDAAVEAYESIRGEVFDVSYRLERLEARINEDRDEADVLEEAA
ncbi:MAG: hypothetical protein ACR2NL_02420, partial [Acidimicrobiia bacterium]